MKQPVYQVGFMATYDNVFFLITHVSSYLHISSPISFISHASCSRHEHGCIYWVPSQGPTPKS